MKRQERRKQRDERINQEFRKLAAVKEFNVQKHSTAWIIQKLAENWCLSPTTIERIITTKSQ